MENMKLEGHEPVVYIKEECTNISALNPIDLNIQDEEEIGDKSEHKVYCSLTVVNPEEITCDSIGSEMYLYAPEADVQNFYRCRHCFNLQDYNSDWVFGLQSNLNNTNSGTTDGGTHLPHQSVKNNEPLQPVVECELSNDSTFSRLNDNSSSDNSNMYTYYSLPNDSSLVNFSLPETPQKRVDFKDWNKTVPEQKKVVVKVEKSPPVKKTFTCPICNKLFATKSNLERHGVVHCDVKPFKCVECNRMFSRRVHLERHKFLHMDNKPFNCEVCKKGFTQKSHLDKHRYIHTGVKPFVCVLCPKTFARKESLNRHKAIHAANEQKEAAAADIIAEQNNTAKTKKENTIVPEKSAILKVNDNTYKNNLGGLTNSDIVQLVNEVTSTMEGTKKLN